MIAIESDRAGMRLDQFLAGHAPHLSRSRIQALIKSGHALLNGRQVKAGEKVRIGDRITLDEPPPIATTTAPEDIALDVLFEDADLVVVNKPAGMVVHPAAGSPEHTLVNALLHHCPELSGIGGEQRPGIVHRLDKETSGCIVVAKNDIAHQRLAQQFAGRDVCKIYLALAGGGPFRFKHGVIEAAIGRHPVHRKKMTVLERGRARTAKTEYRVLRGFGDWSLVECKLHTGRTHQIRVHLKHLGHPLLGDKLYGGHLATRSPRQMLHAWQLGFSHPRTAAWIQLRAPLPPDFIETGAGAALEE